MGAGFGFIDKVTSKPFAIKVSDKLDYEISFWFKQPTRLPTFEISIKCFDCNLNNELIPIDIISGASNNVMLPGNVQITSLENRWNFWHGILYNSNQTIQAATQPLTSHAAGTNLIMKLGTAKLFVNVTCVQTCMLLWDFKVKPANTPFSTGFIQSDGLIEVWRKNNKKDLTQTQIDTIAKQFLIPYDASMSVINI
jgi:hypothetical protein